MSRNENALRGVRWVIPFKWLLYRNYRISSSMKHRFRRRFTSGGMLVMFGLLVTAGIGVDTNIAVAYQAVPVLFGLMVVAALWLVIPRPVLGLRRELPLFATAGEPLDYVVRVENPTARKQDNVTLLEEMADPRPTFTEFLRIPEPGERNRNGFDRALGYFRWRWLVSQKRVVKAREIEVPKLGRRSKGEVVCQITPMKRGILRFTGVTIASPDPFGLIQGFKRLPLPDSLVVLPKRYPLPPLALPGTRKYQQGGIALASSVGDSEEFVSLRDYRQGDPLRRIHWKSWARLGKPIVKEYEDEFFVRHALILDTFLDRGDEDRFEEAVSVAASFACGLETRESLLDLMFVGPRAFCFTSGRGLAHSEQMLQILASVEVCTEQPFESLERQVLGRLDEVSSCICILLNWGRTRRDFIERLKLRGIPLLVFVIVPREGAKGLDAGPLAGTPGSFHPLEMGRIEEDLRKL